MFDAYLGPTNGVYRLSDAAVEPLGLESERIWAIHAWRDHGGVTILAGSYGNGLYRSEDGGASWSRADEGLTASAFRCLGPDPLNQGALLAGTEPARLLRSDDGGETWTCEPVLEDEDIHHITGHPDDHDLLYASLGYASLTYRGRDDHGHQFGGIARSRDDHPAVATRSRPGRPGAAGRAGRPHRRLGGWRRQLDAGRRRYRDADAR